MDTMKVTTENIDFSIFSISLQQFLAENHPLLSDDTDFIKSRGDGAAEIFELFRANGATIEAAIASANEYLFKDLHFSIQNMVKEILEEEFANLVDPEHSWRIVLQLLQVYHTIVSKYELGDEFEESDDYHKLYTEITGAILIHFNEYGI